jgi:hypothetical protein
LPLKPPRLANQNDSDDHPYQPSPGCEFCPRLAALIPPDDMGKGGYEGGCSAARPYFVRKRGGVAGGLSFAHMGAEVAEAE